jgi:hypothetical protein
VRSGLGRLLAALAIGGLIAWLWQPDGRLLLLMLVCALAPFSVTWTVIGGAEWRLTFFSYAFELLAAFWFLEMLVRRAPRFWTLTRPQILKPLVVVSALVTVFAAWTFAMPYAVVREALTTGSTAIIPAGRRDAWFFDGGWSRLVRAGKRRQPVRNQPGCNSAASSTGSSTLHTCDADPAARRRGSVADRGRHGERSGHWPPGACLECRAYR